MKKIFPVLVLAVVVASCNNTDAEVAAATDSLRAAQIADSLSKITAPGDTSSETFDSLAGGIDSATTTADNIK